MMTGQMIQVTQACGHTVPIWLTEPKAERDLRAGLQVELCGRCWHERENSTISARTAASFAKVVRATPVETRPVCSECGERRDRADFFCFMSNDGEGPHRWIAREPLAAEDAEFLRSVEIHNEEGGMER